MSSSSFVEFPEVVAYVSNAKVIRIPESTDGVAAEEFSRAQLFKLKCLAVDKA